jgi:hypothetical protein
MNIEKGFFHPELGYWQTISEPSSEILTAYPIGTVEVALKPSIDHQYLNGKWVYVAPQTPIEAGSVE